MNVNGKVIIVTGASSGMGKSIAQLLSERGAIVIAAARSINKLEDISAASKKNAHTIVPYQIDVTKKDEINQMMDTVYNTYGKIDVLFNNAGRSDDFSFAGETTDEMWRDVLSLNLDAAFYATRAVLQYMLKAKSGNIINTASVAGIGYARGGLAYTVSKHALIALTKNTAFGYAKEGVRCNAICPGTIDTPLVQALSDTSNLDQAGFAKCISGAENAPRVGNAEEIANIALFLASDASGLLNGAILVADAGWTSY